MKKYLKIFNVFILRKKASKLTMGGEGKLIETYDPFRFYYG